MNKSKPSKALVQKTLIAVIGTVMIGGLAFTLWSAEPPSDPQSKTNSVETNTTSSDTNKTVVRKRLTGAELYSMHCNRCHPERYPTERTAAQWKTIMLHMQVRANLPPEQVRLILKYLQENSGR